MGYQRKKRYVLEFPEDSEFYGLVVRMKPVAVGQVLDASRSGEEANADLMEQRFRQFADGLDSWNLEDEDGASVPATYEGVLSTDIELLGVLYDAWETAIGGGVSEGKGESSNSGKQFPEGLIPMDTSSPSLAS